MDNTIYETSIRVIASAAALLDDEKQKDYFSNVTESLNYAMEMVEGVEEKRVRLNDAAVKFANQIMFILFRKDVAPKEMLDLFRTLPTPEETAAEVEKFEQEYRAKVDKINAEQKAVMDERKSLDIFLAVISGMTKEQAEAKMKQYEEQIAQMNNQ